jgi:hypothetical protein
MSVAKNTEIILEGMVLILNSDQRQDVTLTRARHNQQQFDESTVNLSIDIVDCRLLIDLRNSVDGMLLQNYVL